MLVYFMEVDLEAVIKTLSSTSFCEGLDRESLAAIAGKMQARSFAAGETLAEPGDPVTEFWIVAEGEIDAFVTDARGRDRAMGIIRQGETIGEVAILEEALRPIRFRARTHGTLLVAPAATFRDWISAFPPLMRNLFHTLSSRYRQAVGIEVRPLPSPRLGIVASSPRGQRLTGRLVARLLGCGERLRVWAETPAQLRAAGGWPQSVPIENLSPTDQPLLEPAAPDVDRQIVVWSPPANAELDPRLLRGCDEVLWCLEPAEAAATSQNLRRASETSPELIAHVRIVWLLDANTPVAPLTLSDWTWKKPPLKAHVASTGTTLTRLENQGLDRIVRAQRGISLGLALAGGGAKGMAHLGVLRVLEEAGLSFDLISGTSAGAMVGILYASGMAPETAIQNFNVDLTPSRWFQMLPGWPNWYMVTQYRRRSWEHKLRRYLFDWRLEQLPIPFYAVTTDLVQATSVLRHEGDAAQAILESINLPIVSQPILREGMVLVDGGILNNLPGDVLVEKGVDFVVGVDVSKHIRHEFAGNRPNTPSNKMKPVGAIDTLFRVFESQANNLGKIRNQAIDFWIAPDTSGFGLAEFHRIRELADAGEAAAGQRVAQLKQRLLELEQRLLGTPRKG